MASFGHVLDLLDERYLNLHDVVGNVEPMPQLVPYEGYGQSVLVLRMDTNHELFMGLIHEFTARIAQETRQEIWTWLVQWEIKSRVDIRFKVAAPSPKKPRLEANEHKPESIKQETQPRAPIIDIFERCVIRPELMKEEDLLRILVDIVQVDSSIVPNFIEFLYRWIDYYEGDGTALKAALKWEIPSLWDFEHHPLILPADIRRQMEKDKAEKGKHREKEEENEREPNGTPVKTSRAQDLAQCSPTKKMREKPDLAAMERQTQESERLQYREVRYGIRPPKINLPMSPLINIPRDGAQRLKYYAACFKSRHRALVHLMESGLSMRQISNYQKLQKEHPKDTPETLGGGGPMELKGLRHYYKDADAAQGIHKLKEKLQLQREKQKEIAISSKLAVEAQVAAATNTACGTSGIPLIPSTPSYNRPPDMAGEMFRRIQAAKLTGPERINFVPAPVVGRMKSELFENAQDLQSLPATLRPGLTAARELPVRRPVQGEELNSDDNGEEDGSDEENDNDEDGTDSDEEGSDSNGSSEDDDDDPSGLPNPAPAPPATAHYAGASIVLGGLPAGAHLQNVPNMARRAMESPLQGRQTATVNALFQHLAPEQAQSLLPLTDPRSRQVLAANIARRMPGNQAPTPGNPTFGATRDAPPGMQAATTVSFPSMNGIANVSMTREVGQTRSVPMPFLPPPPIRPPTVTVPPRANPLSLPVLLPPVRSPAHAVTPIAGPSAPSLGHRSTSFQSYGRPPASTFQLTNSSSGQVAPRALLGLPMPPQALRPQHGQPGASAVRSLPASHLPPPAGAPGLVAPVQQQDTTRSLAMQQLPASRILPLSGTPDLVPRPIAGPQTSGLEYHTATSHMHQSPHASRSLFALPNTQHFDDTERAFSQQRLHAGDTRSLHNQLLRPTTSQSLQRATSSVPLSPDTWAEHQNQASPPPSRSMLAPPRIGIQRNAPTPLNLPPPPAIPSPFSSLAPSLLATTPFLPDPHGIPVQMYFPKIVVPGNGIGPGGRRLGTEGVIETDALLVGHTHPGTGKITLTKALFLPLGVWSNTMNRVRKKAYSMIETYAPPRGHPGVTGKLAAIGSGPCHAAVYSKLAEAYNIMRSSSAKQRELSLTKRWRASKGPMTQQDRGAVWEGYGVTLEKPIEMSAEERKGAIIYSWLVDEGVEKKPESSKTEAEKERDRLERELKELEREEEEMGIDWDEVFANDEAMELS